MQNFEICRSLLQIKAIKLNANDPFIWASGMRSPIYCDNRVALSYPEIRSSIKWALNELSKKFEPYAVIAGVATAGIAHGALLADLQEKPFCYVRPEAKSHGRQNQIEGDLQAGAKVLVVEDLISTGASSIKVVEVLRDQNVDVVGVIAIFDYGFNVAKQAFEHSNCNYAALATYAELIQQAKSSGYISEEDGSILKLWSEDPKGWYDNHYSKR